MRFYGSLARSGKVKYQTPRVERTASRRYKGGRSKFRKHAASNMEYKSGAHRSEQVTNNSSNNNTPNTSSRIPDQLDARMNETQAPYFLMNSYHKYNSPKGFERTEFIAEKLEIKRDKMYYLYHADLRGDARNHKKWHRNHPQDGFYQFRETFDFANEQDLDDLEIFQYFENLTLHQVLEKEVLTHCADYLLSDNESNWEAKSPFHLFC
ncbi:hypothetical protein C9374_009951 [Naegleria lovaniensis]|uniref:Uncharacterized protein n=1 Tax=Naegleria lovaniensis TaxID=51637 RepID=A0AA88GI46_NAELO|nr:uncharacterized protein C9374_009951 [Naegleria lovaniensis]KAG2375328.1 hypothetical protein C9374_009951 [Naegleria lovaniensis]